MNTARITKRSALSRSPASQSEPQHKPAADPIRVAVIDDHPMLRSGLVHTLKSAGGIEIVAEGATAAEAVQIAETLLPDLIFIDIRMPGDGIVAAQAISRSCPAVKIIMLTAHDDEQRVTAALRAGASGYIVKGVSEQELVQSVHAIYEGESYVSPGLAAKLLSTRGFGTPWLQEPDDELFLELTPREEQVLRRITQGLSNREVGDQLGISEKTVKHYMTNILEKLHVRNRVELALLARKRMTSN